MSLKRYILFVLLAVLAGLAPMGGVGAADLDKEKPVSCSDEWASALKRCWQDRIDRTYCETKANVRRENCLVTGTWDRKLLP
jgi:hypothetical protein